MSDASDELVLGHPFWGQCDCDDEDEHQRRVAEVAPYTKEIERLRRFETVALKALAKATTWHEMFEGRTRARDQAGRLIPVRDLIKAEAFVSEVAAHYARLAEERADEAEGEIERLRAEIEELKVRDIVARNPGIDPDEVRRHRRDHAHSDVPNHDRTTCGEPVSSERFSISALTCERPKGHVGDHSPVHDAMEWGLADEIERLRGQVERVEQAIESQWQYGKGDVRIITLHRLRAALDG